METRATWGSSRKQTCQQSRSQGRAEAQGAGMCWEAPPAASLPCKLLRGQAQDTSNPQPTFPAKSSHDPGD